MMPAVYLFSFTSFLQAWLKLVTNWLLLLPNTEFGPIPHKYGTRPYSSFETTKIKTSCQNSSKFYFRNLQRFASRFFFFLLIFIFLAQLINKLLKNRCWLHLISINFNIDRFHLWNWIVPNRKLRIPALRISPPLPNFNRRDFLRGLNFRPKSLF